MSKISSSFIPTTSSPFKPSDRQFVKLFSAAFYAVSSFLIVVVNKTVLTTYSLPMFTVLRKFTIVLTMIMEAKILRKSFSPQLACSVVAIMFGALIAASSDLAFEAEGYAFVLLNDVFTAANGVYTKQKIGIEGLGQYGVLFYNAFIIIIPTILTSAYTGDLEKAVAFKGWVSLGFIFYFILSSIMGHHNSALTTTVIGAIKNVAVAYIGMFLGGDYAFSWPNFVGLNICISGGLVYSYLTFQNTSSSSPHTETQEKEQPSHVVDEPHISLISQRKDHLNAQSN